MKGDGPPVATAQPFFLSFFSLPRRAPLFLLALLLLLLLLLRAQGFLQLRRALFGSLLSTFTMATHLIHLLDNVRKQMAIF